MNLNKYTRGWRGGTGAFLEQIMMKILFTKIKTKIAHILRVLTV